MSEARRLIAGIVIGVPGLRGGAGRDTNDNTTDIARTWARLCAVPVVRARAFAGLRPPNTIGVV